MEACVRLTLEWMQKGNPRSFAVPTNRSRKRGVATIISATRDFVRVLRRSVDT